MNADLRAVLREYYVATDPVPARMREAAVAVFAWRDVEHDLAELSMDSLLVAAPVRNRGGPRLVTFLAGDTSIEIEVDGTGPTRQIVGQVVPPATGEVRVRNANHVERADDLGRFFFADVPAGTFSLSWAPDLGTGCNTAWIEI
ncbi:MAG: hypothetical protein ACT4QG_20485 [Sporichthyaceae bacterium]